MSAARAARRRYERERAKLANRMQSTRYDTHGPDVAIAHLQKNGANFERMIEAQAMLIMQHGLPPSHRAVTAAHEAGHAVLSTALGGTLIEAYLKPSATLPGAWDGYNLAPIPGVHAENFAFDPRVDPVRAIAVAGHLLGGFAGEYVAGYGHPASSIEEISLVVMAVHSLVEGTDDCLAPLLATVRSLIEANRSAFDAMSNQLMVADRITTIGAEITVRITPIEFASRYVAALAAAGIQPKPFVLAAIGDQQ